jgi:hypothetical protein
VTRRIAVLALLLALSIVGLRAQQYSIAPSPFQTVLNNNGDKVSNACVWTYQAGTTTPIVTYADTIGTPNLNPIRTDSAGRFTAYLVPGTGYKFTYELACTPPAHGVLLRTADNITGTPATSGNVDSVGVAGETLTPGQVVYLSDGQGAKTAGQWYKADAALDYSSTTPPIGVAVGNLASGATGAIRIYGLVTGLTGLSPGATSYVGTAGAMTTTPPANVRVVGVAQSATTLILATNPSPTASATVMDNGVDDFRLTLTTGTPVTVTDVTAATTLYLSPYTGNRIALFNATGTATTTVSGEVSIALPAAASQLYDVFGWSNGGIVTLELLAWTNDTTRATAIVRTTTGAWTKSGDLTRRYLGSVRTTTVAGQTEDSTTKRFVWNVANRVVRPLQRFDTTDSWTYTLATWRQANGALANQVEVVIGVAETAVDVSVDGFGANTMVTAISTAIGYDTRTAPTRGAIGVINGAGIIVQMHSQFTHVPSPGYHYYAWLEFSNAAGVTTWYGDNGVAALMQSGLTGLLVN